MYMCSCFTVFGSIQWHSLGNRCLYLCLLCICICLSMYLTKSRRGALGCNGLALFTFAGRCDEQLAQFLSSNVTQIISSSIISIKIKSPKTKIKFASRCDEHAQFLSSQCDTNHHHKHNQHKSQLCYQYIMIHPINMDMKKKILADATSSHNFSSKCIFRKCSFRKCSF